MAMTQEPAQPAPMTTDLLHTSALEQARLIRSRHISSEELVRLYLTRISRLNPTLNAFVQVLADRALATARKKDAETRRSPSTLPPFHGVPIGIKDLNFARGTFTRFGSRALRFLWSPVDDKATAQIRRGGFVITGKLATSELGALPVTEPDIHPPTRNPWNLDVTAGGSSGGSGAAVAAGLLPIAQGSDGAGSIRIPSSFCHLYGIKPSRGRVVDPYGREEDLGLSTVGPMARTVEDAAALLDVMCGISVGEPYKAPPPEAPFLSLARRSPTPLRIKVTVESPLVKAHPDVAEATHRVARTLESLGHHVDEGAPPEGSLDEFLPLWQHIVAGVPVPRWSLTQPVTQWLAAAGKLLVAADVRARHLELDRRVAAWFGDVDLWITPTVAEPPVRVGAWKGLDPEQAFRRAARLGAFTALFNITGQPAATVPAGLTKEGLPIGVQIAGRALADATVLAVSRQIEEALPWAERRAPDI